MRKKTLRKRSRLSGKRIERIATVEKLYLSKVPFPNQYQIEKVVVFLRSERNRLYPLLVNARFVKRFGEIPTNKQVDKMVRQIKKARYLLPHPFVESACKHMGTIASLFQNQSNRKLMRRFKNEYVRKYGRQALKSRDESDLFYPAILKKTVKECHALLNPLFIDKRETWVPPFKNRAIRMTANLINFILLPLQIRLTPKDVEGMIFR